ncbi:MAG: alanine racemase [Candidatus Cloacimonetes bacterium]|nr:alanine racemase [Candidatus Cloacimonadota bacterium]
MPSDRSWVDIDLDAFTHNLNRLKAFLHPHQQFLQIVKADAYGHGAYEIGKSALLQGASFLGVANLEEGRLLRLQGITAPILILSPSHIDEIPGILEYDLIPTLTDLTFARALDRAVTQDRIPVHVKIDTGMHRSGFDHERSSDYLGEIATLPKLTIEGIFSHYAASESDPEFTALQADRFESIICRLNPRPRYIHLANSSGTLSHNPPYANLVRFGILSYGIYTHPSQKARIDLRPVMSFRSRIALIKTVKAGDSVGYNLTWTAPNDTTCAIVPIGYADGYDFLLANRASACIRGKLYPVIGRISMDMICLDLGTQTRIRVDDEVTLLGGGSDLTRSEYLSDLFQGSAYELLCQIGRRARRYYYQGGKLASSAPLSRRDFVSADFSDTKLNRIIESAISHRLRNDEIGELVYREILRSLFFQKDHDIHLRNDFVHEISFSPSDIHPEFWLVHTRLSFRKIVQNPYFIVACAPSSEILNRYFARRDVEYRWLLDSNFDLKPEFFEVSKVTVAEHELTTTTRINQGCLEIRCEHPDLSKLVGFDAPFSIETLTYYDRRSHQLSVFITELTRGITIRFIHPPSILKCEAVTIFSGQNKYPQIIRDNNAITICTKPEEWIFPMSGVVFAY